MRMNNILGSLLAVTRPVIAHYASRLTAISWLFAIIPITITIVDYDRDYDYGRGIRIADVQDKAHVDSQRYKEGKYILERSLITDVED